MFKNEYQGGPYVDVFSPQGRDPAAQWKLTGSVKKEFDKSIRGYVYALEGGVSTTTTRMQLPKSDKSSLSLVQPCCVFQLMVPDSAKFTIDLNISDHGGRRRRINLSSSQRELSATPLNARVPLGDLVTGQWVHLCVDVGSLVELLFKGSKFKSLEGISLGGSCRLKRIFTLQTTPTSTDNAYFAPIPRSFHISSIMLTTQIVSPGLWTALGHFTTESSSHSSLEQRPTHVAFGKKVAIPDHILTSRQSTEHDSAVTGLVQPHPPTAPANQSLLKIQRSRVRSVSGKSLRRGGAKLNPSSTRKVSSQTGHSESEVTAREVTAREVTASEVTASEVTAHETSSSSQSSSSVHCADSILSKDEQLVVNILRSGGGGGGRREPIVPAEPTDSDEQVYSFRSAPKSAERHAPSIPISAEKSSRGARLEEDFHPHKMTPPLSPDIPNDNTLENTRLSDDYDWRQYASTEENRDQFHQSADESLRTRLASHHADTVPGSHHTPPDTACSGLEDTFSETMTLSGLAEHLRDGPHTSLLDSMETRTMGGMLSPALLDSGHQGQQLREANTSASDEDEVDNGHPSKLDEIELMYDPQLNCFYDPLTCKYYELQSD